jgi:hypothetical protein
VGIGKWFWNVSALPDHQAVQFGRKRSSSRNEPCKLGAECLARFACGRNRGLGKRSSVPRAINGPDRASDRRPTVKLTEIPFWTGPGRLSNEMGTRDTFESMEAFYAHVGRAERGTDYPAADGRTLVKHVANHSRELRGVSNVGRSTPHNVRASH